MTTDIVASLVGLARNDHRLRKTRRRMPVIDALEERGLMSSVGGALDAFALHGAHAVAHPAAIDSHHAIEADSVSIMAAKHAHRRPHHHGRTGGAAKGHKHGHSGPVGSNPGTPAPVGSNPGTPTPVGSNPGTPVPVGANPGTTNPASFGTQLQGNWRVNYDPSATFGPGSRAVQEIVFTAPGADGFGQFTATTGLSVPGYFGPAYYQYTSYGIWTQLDATNIRMTIQGASPTEYLDRGIIVLGGQFLEVNFLNQDQFSSSGNIYNRIPLNSSVFGP